MKRIAIVEDNADNRLLILAVLAGRYALAAYETGPEGLAGMRAQRPDLIILDIGLPTIDGFAVLHELRTDAELRAVPVVALTAHAMNGFRERCLEASFDAYVTKPIVDLGQFRRTLEEVMERGTAPIG